MSLYITFFLLWFISFTVNNYKRLVILGFNVVYLEFMKQNLYPLQILSRKWSDEKGWIPDFAWYFVGLKEYWLK